MTNVNNKSILEKRRDSYVGIYCENAREINYTELTEAQGLEKVFYDEISSREMRGFPVASDFVLPNGKACDMNEYENLTTEEKKSCRLRYYYLPNCHELCAGTTGSGKTTGCVDPQIRALAGQKNKPHIFATDPKGELFEKHGAYMQEKGYELYVLSFRDIFKSHSWNPLAEFYDEQQKRMKIGADLKEVSGSKDGYILNDDPSEYGEKFFVSGGKAFADYDRYCAWVEVEKELAEAKIEQLVNQFACNAIPVETQKDPLWEYGARDLLHGLILLCLEDIENGVGPTKEQFNMRTIHELYLNLRVPIVADECSFNSHPLIKGRKGRAVDHMRSSLQNAPNTTRSYLGVFDNKMRNWFQTHIYQLTKDTTIDIKNVAKEKPIAVFVSTRDYEKSDYFIATSFIDYFYRIGLEMAEQDVNARAIHFLLDEFGNIPKISDFENKIATSRSRNMWFHLYVQSYEQLESLYGANGAEIIRDNCNALLFLGSQNLSTLETFSKTCGKATVPSYQSYIGAEGGSLSEVTLLPISKLDLIKPGHIYLKRLFLPLINAQYIRSYVAAEQGAYAYYKAPLQKNIFAKRTSISSIETPYDRSKPVRRKSEKSILDEWGVFDD